MSHRRAAACLYAPAVDAMEEGDYARAAGMLEKIPGFQDSKALLMQCYYYQGLALLEEGDYENAAVFFDLAPDLALAQEAKKDCVYYPALALLEDGDTEKALEIFLTIPEHRDSADYIYQILSDRAKDQTDPEEYAAAIAALEQLEGQTGFDAQKLRAAQYEYALFLIDNAQYEQAIERLSALGEYREAPENLNRARYLLALDLRAKGNYEEALAILEALGAYEDALMVRGAE